MAVPKIRFSIASLIVLSVIWGLIWLGMVALVGSFYLIYLGKQIPEGLSVTVVAAVVAALGAILARTGHDAANTPPPTEPPPGASSEQKSD